jgi:hypothetical protein
MYMKSIIKKILKEEFRKPKIYNSILKDILTTFNRDTINEVSLHADNEWKRQTPQGYSSNSFNYYSITEDIAKNIIIPYLTKIYGIDIRENNLRYNLVRDWIKKNYGNGNMILPGDTIEMIEMIDDPNPITPGTMGVVEDIVLGFGSEEHLVVDWENGRSLKVILGFDKIKKIS